MVPPFHIDTKEKRNELNSVSCPPQIFILTQFRTQFVRLFLWIQFVFLLLFLDKIPWYPVTFRDLDLEKEHVKTWFKSHSIWYVQKPKLIYAIWEIDLVKLILICFSGLLDETRFPQDKGTFSFLFGVDITGNLWGR